MPGYLLTTASTVMCMHAGQAQPTASDPRVKAAGAAVTTQPAPYSVSGCSLPPPSAGNGPCVIAQWLTAAVRVKASGMPVLLQDSQSICTPSGTPLQIIATQMRVKAV